MGLMRTDRDGIHIRQSDIETFLACPEQLRLTYLDNPSGEGFESDAALVGTCLHETIHNELVHGQFSGLEDAVGFAIGVYGRSIVEFAENGWTFSRETFKDDKHALKSLVTLVEAWWWCDERKMLLGRDDYVSEWSFDVPFMQIQLPRRKEPTQIWLSGTSDLVFPEGVWDWKSSSGPYQKWEKQRWAVQPTVYTYAAQHEGLLLPDFQGEFTFTYKVFVRSSQPSEPLSYPVKRSQGSFEWLRQVVSNMVLMMAAMPNGPWPLNDHSALCGPKWCPFWGECKGKYVSKETWT